MRLLPIIPIILVLSGCLDLGKQHQNNTGPTLTRADVLTPEELDKHLLAQKHEVRDDIKRDIQDSSNAIQANVNSLIGGSIGKLGEKVTGLELGMRDLVHVSADLKASFSSSIDSTVQLSNKMNTNLSAVADLQAKVESQIKLNAELNAKLQAVGNAQVGLSNDFKSSISEMKQDFKAGGDIVNSQFTKEMLEALKSANKTTVDTSLFYALILVGIVVAACLVLLALVHRGVKKAEGNADYYQKMMVRASSLLPPEQGREFNKELR